MTEEREREVFSVQCSVFRWRRWREGGGGKVGDREREYVGVGVCGKALETGKESVWVCGYVGVGGKERGSRSHLAEASAPG
jgi:hypothetical protein